MDPLKVAAHFAAFTCYLNSKTKGPLSPKEAGRYARTNWKCYLPYVREDLGKFLTEPSSPSPKPRQRSAWRNKEREKAGA
jgi:hypothetical protein